MLNTDVFSERGAEMWVTTLCPKCGVKNELNLNELGDQITCQHCFDRFPLPVQFRSQIQQENTMDYVVLADTDQSLDSSFWLS